MAIKLLTFDRYMIKVYITSVGVMLFDLSLSWSGFIFYIPVNAILIYRVFGSNWITRGIHVGIFYFGLFFLLQLYIAQSKHVSIKDRAKILHYISHLNILLPMIITYGIQFILGTYLMAIRPLSPSIGGIRNYHNSIHTCLGIMTVIMQFWSLLSESSINVNHLKIESLNIICLMLYFLLFLMMLLKPDIKGGIRKNYKLNIEEIPVTIEIQRKKRRRGTYEETKKTSRNVSTISVIAAKNKSEIKSTRFGGVSFRLPFHDRSNRSSLPMEENTDSVTVKKKKPTFIEQPQPDAKK